LELYDEALVSGLAQCVTDIGAQNGRFWRRLNGRIFKTSSGQVTTFPRLMPLRHLKGPIWPKTGAKQTSLQIAASHVKGRLMSDLMRGVFRTESKAKLLIAFVGLA